MASSGATPLAKVGAPAAQCSICLEEVEDCTTALNCRHVFCYDCITHWLLLHNRCPLCRSVIIQVVHQVTEAGSALPVERIEEVPEPEEQRGFVMHMGFLTMVHTPAESPICMLVPINIPPSVRFFYMVRILEPDHTLFFGGIDPGTLFVLPQDLAGVTQALESFNIFRVEPGIHGEVPHRHVISLSEHVPHQNGNQAQAALRQSTSTADPDEDDLD